MTSKKRHYIHQDIMAIERNYQGCWEALMLGDQCWLLERDEPEASESYAFLIPCLMVQATRKLKSFYKH